MKTITYPVSYETNENGLGAVIASSMLAHKKCPDLHVAGFWFCFGSGEDCGFKRKCPAFYAACSEFVRAAKMNRKNIELFRNANAEIALRMAE